MFFNTIDDETLQLLKAIQRIPEFSELRLVGGTALALQIGHRISVDLDLFGTWNTDGPLEPLLKQCGHLVVDNVQKSMQFFTVNGIKTDFVRYDYPWLEPALSESGIRLASIPDIGAMKINAIINRGTKKDFIDLYYLLGNHSLEAILGWFKAKYSTGNVGTALRSLVFFDDADDMPMPRMLLPLNWEKVKTVISEKVREFAG